MQLQKLEEHNEIGKDLLRWIKYYLIEKFTDLPKDNVKDSFDLAYLTSKMNKASSIEDVEKVSREAGRMGLKTSAFHSNLSKLHHALVTDGLERMTDISHITVSNAILKVYHDATVSTKDTIYSHARAFFNWVEDWNTIEGTDKPFMFNVSKDSDGNPVPLLRTRKHKPVPHFLETEEMKTLNKSILAFPYENEREKVMAILVVRLLMFGGISASELSEIKDIDFRDYKENGVLGLELAIHGSRAKERVIPLPRKKLIKYINRYKELRNCKSGYFFCSEKKPDSKIVGNTINNILKEQFKFAEVNPRLRATVDTMQNSFVIFLHRRGYSKKKIQMLRGLSTYASIEKLIRVGSTDRFSASHLFSEFEDN